MTPKQRRFVEEYLVDRNATQAAVRAGYSAKSAARTGWRLRQIPAVRLAIAEAARDREDRREMSRDRVLVELARVAFASSGEYLDWGPDAVALKHKTVLTPDQQAAVAEITQSRTKTGHTLRFKLYDKLAALKEISRLLGYAAGAPGADQADDPEIAELSETERVQRLLALLARARARRLAGEGQTAEDGPADDR